MDTSVFINKQGGKNEKEEDGICSYDFGETKLVLNMLQIIRLSDWITDYKYHITQLLDENITNYQIINYHNRLPITNYQNFDSPLIVSFINEENKFIFILNVFVFLNIMFLNSDQSTCS